MSFLRKKKYYIQYLTNVFFIFCTPFLFSVFAADNPELQLNYPEVSRSHLKLAQNTDIQPTETQKPNESLILKNERILIFSTSQNSEEFTEEDKGEFSVMIISDDKVISISINDQVVSLKKYNAYLIEAAISYDKDAEPWIADVIVQTDRETKKETFEIGQKQKIQKSNAESTFFALLQLGYKQEDNLRHLHNNNDNQNVESYHGLVFLSYVYGGLNSIYLDLMYYKDQYNRKSISEDKRPDYEKDIDIVEVERSSFSIAYRRYRITEFGVVDIGFSYIEYKTTAYKKLSISPDTENKYYISYADFIGNWTLDINTDFIIQKSKYKEGSNYERSGNKTTFQTKLKYEFDRIELDGYYKYNSIKTKGAFEEKSVHTIRANLSYLLIQDLFASYSYTLSQSSYSELNTDYGITPKTEKKTQDLSLLWNFHSNFSAKLYYKNMDYSGNHDIYRYENNFMGVLLNAYY